jgi:hypothetical protein
MEKMTKEDERRNAIRTKIATLSEAVNAKFHRCSRIAVVHHLSRKAARSYCDSLQVHSLGDLVVNREVLLIYSDEPYCRYSHEKKKKLKQEADTRMGLCRA